MKNDEPFEHQAPDLPTLMAELQAIIAESGAMEHRKECLMKIHKLLEGRQNHLERMV